MEYNIINLLEKIGMAQCDIKELLENHPGLMIVDAKRAAKNISVMMSVGMKKGELEEFSLMNPSYLFYDPKELEEKLRALGEGAIQKILADPSLI